MLLLYCTNMCADQVKYQKLLATCQHVKPTHVIINGNVFSTKNKGSTNLNDILMILNEISKISKIFLNLGGFDSKENSEAISRITNPNIKNLTNNIITESVFQFVGISYTNHQDQNQWTLNDGLLDCKPELDNSEILIKQRCNEKTILNTIFVSYQTPLGILDYDPNPYYRGSYNIRRLCEGEFTGGKQPILLLTASSFKHFEKTKEWYKLIGNCLCIQPSQDNELFYFSLLEIEPPMNITTFYHPYDRIEIMKNIIDYRRIS